MKKVLLLAVAFLGFTAAQAQDEATTGGFENGDVFVSGSLSFTSDSPGGNADSVTSFSIAPKVGFFVSEDIAVGAGLSYQDSTPGFADGSEFGFDVFGRYYFTADSQFSIFGELNVGYDTRDSGVDGTDLDGTFGAALSPAVSYFVSDCFAIEASFAALGFQSTGDASSFGFGVNSNINFGLVYKF